MASTAKRGKRGLGSGLAAILPEASAEHAGELRELPVEVIKPNPNQPRTKIDPESLAGLASSIEANGVVQPLLVRPLPDGSYELIAGERRWRAAQAAGLAKVPAVVRDQELAERLQVALIENMVREDLNPVDEARACAALVDELGLSREELGPPRRPQPPRRLQPDPPARPSRRGARAARVGRAQRGPRPRPARRRRQRRPPPPRPRRGARRLVGPRDREQG